jgi:hypothetical protein
VRRLFIVLAGIAALSCSSADSGGPGLDCSGGTCLVPPMLSVENQGGASIAHMDVWTVVWRGDEAIGTSVDTFNGAVLGSDYMMTSLSEYGAGAGTARGVIVLGPPPATVDDDALAAVLAALPGSTTTSGARVREPDANTVVTFVIPKTTQPPLDSSYHAETGALLPAAGGASIHEPYIVLRQDSVGYVSDFDYLTWTQSHELVEVATDPHPDTAEAWLSPALDVYGEVADLCNDIPVQRTLGGTNYMLTRVYSRARAQARTGDPCVPGLDVPYANIALSPLSVTLPSAIGASATLRLHAFSSGSTAVLSWVIFTDASFDTSPQSGTLAPGEETTVTIRRASGSPGYPTDVALWVLDPQAPHSGIPLQESFGAIGP